MRAAARSAAEAAVAEQAERDADSIRRLEGDGRKLRQRIQELEESVRWGASRVPRPASVCSIGTAPNRLCGQPRRQQHPTPGGWQEQAAPAHQWAGKTTSDARRGMPNDGAHSCLSCNCLHASCWSYISHTGRLPLHLRTSSKLCGARCHWGVQTSPQPMQRQRPRTSRTQWYSTWRLCCSTVQQARCSRIQAPVSSVALPAPG